MSTLTQSTDGNFYGTTAYGGTYGLGTVFKISPAGTLNTHLAILPPAFVSPRNEGATQIRIRANAELEQLVFEGYPVNQTAHPSATSASGP
jgi:uncharacterized repeat protein (TIGR03803 family)